MKQWQLSQKFPAVLTVSVRLSDGTALTRRASIGLPLKSANLKADLHRQLMYEADRALKQFAETLDQPERKPYNG